MNNSIVINNIPSTNRKDFGYRAINTSNMHNKNQEEMLSDILDLFNKTNAIERTINEKMDYIKLENSKLESINKALLEKYTDLMQKYNSLILQEQDRKCIITPHDCSVTDENFGAIINKDTSDITVRPVRKLSKLVITDTVTDTVFLPETLEVEVRNVNTKGIVSEVDSDIYAPFYNDNNLYWTRAVVTDNTVEALETEYIINMPEEIMTTPKSNEIFINPFMCMVKAVYGRYGDSNRWELIKGQEYHDSIGQDTTINSYINSINQFKLNFEDIKINQLKIVVTTNSYRECENNLRSFTYGLKQVGVYINYYNNYDYSTFEFDVTIPEPLLTPLVTGVVPYFNNGHENSVYARDFSCDIYYKDTANNYHKIVDSFPFTPPTNNLKIKCKFGGKYTSSNIKRIELRYKVAFDVPTGIDVKDIRQIETKGSHVVALKYDGSVWAWGCNEYGEISNTANISTWKTRNTEPTRISGLSSIKQIATGLNFTLALDESGDVYSFGENYYGQLGYYKNCGTHIPNTEPQKIEGLSHVNYIAAGSWHSVAVLDTGEVYTFGYNYYGQLGYNVNVETHNYNYVPSKVVGLHGIKKVTCGTWHTTVLKEDSSVWSFGYNSSGQLGYETEKEYSSTPIKITNF